MVDPSLVQRLYGARDPGRMFQEVPLTGGGEPLHDDAMGTTRLRAASLPFALVLLAVWAEPAAAGPTCLGRAATIVGTPGNDDLEGTNGADVIVGLGGNDRILGRGGNDRICGNGGNDYIDGKPGAERIDGGPGSDTGYGGAGSDDCIAVETTSSCT
jgi:Ca2+-binding RTX toxin-like protein